MDVLDWVIAGFAVAAGAWGFREGLIVGLFGLVGVAGGAALGTHAAQAVSARGAVFEYAPVAGLVCAVVVLGLVVVVFGGIGSAIRSGAGSLPFVRRLDRLGGAVLGVALGTGLWWIIGAVMLDSPVSAKLRKAAQRSVVLRTLNDALPPSGPVLGLLARYDPLPSLAGPEPGVGRPDAAVLGSTGVRRAERSVVRVLGTACGFSIQGSGWVVAPNRVVTNAHVVAGERDTVVAVSGRRPALKSTVVGFDAHNDIAILRVEDLALPTLELELAPTPGAESAILGYPQNGPFEAVAARTGRTAQVVSRDAYGEGPIQRRITSVRGVVREGNSGGPIVDASGRVVATVFAARKSKPAVALGVPGGIVQRDLLEADRTVSTGSCTG